MKKAIRPPENWQDFETLCKKLFGELWGCSNTIMKNGRLGQSQSGVDVFGKPKGETNYWGIQCKGKDNYNDSQLSTKEIDKEITKALQFKPPLKTFVFATTASKDVYIEEYIRLKDQESCKQGNFSILIYSWQDIADLIEENRETFNWYVNEKQFKSTFDVEVSITTKYEEQILRPTFLKTTHDYIYSPTSEKKLKAPQIATLSSLQSYSLFGGSNKINHGWCEFDIIVTNNGGNVIEDWRLWLDFTNGARKIDDDFAKDVLVSRELMKLRTTWAYQDQKQVLCEPLNNSPLIQKTSKGFRAFCIPNYDCKELIVKWHLLARDFDREGETSFIVEPKHETARKTHYVDSTDKVKTETIITDYEV
ncbi:MAG TPA: hypothetical protein PLC65_05240 [Bacteroidia bacterium]|nr:hypothetical protein [Bacteroidia bacterium]